MVTKGKATACVIACVMGVFACSAETTPEEPEALGQVRQAYNCSAGDTDYYNSTFTIQLGERWRNCSGVAGGWGVITAYKVSYSYSCGCDRSTINRWRKG